MKKNNKQEVAKKVIKCASKADYKAVAWAMDECEMHHLFEQVVKVTKVPKAKRIEVEFVPDWTGGWEMDEFWMLCNLPEERYDVNYCVA